MKRIIAFLSLAIGILTFIAAGYVALTALRVMGRYTDSFAGFWTAALAGGGMAFMLLIGGMTLVMVLLIIRSYLK